MPITIKFIGALRKISGRTQLSISIKEGTSIKELITKLNQEMPDLEKTISGDQNEESQANALILINGREISVLNGSETKLANGDEVVFVPVVHGG